MGRRAAHERPRSMAVWCLTKTKTRETQGNRNSHESWERQLEFWAAQREFSEVEGLVSEA